MCYTRDLQEGRTKKIKKNDIILNRRTVLYSRVS